MSSLCITLKGGSPWGFRLQGGREFNEPLRVAKINPNSKAHLGGLKVGDYVDEVNGQKTEGLNHGEVQQLIKDASDQLIIRLRRYDRKGGPDENDFASLEADQSKVKQDKTTYETSLDRSAYSPASSHPSQQTYRGELTGTSQPQHRGGLEQSPQLQYREQFVHTSHPQYRGHPDYSSQPQHRKGPEQYRGEPAHVSQYKGGPEQTLQYGGPEQNRIGHKETSLYRGSEQYRGGPAHTSQYKGGPEQTLQYRAPEQTTMQRGPAQTSYRGGSDQIPPYRGGTEQLLQPAYRGGISSTVLEGGQIPSRFPQHQIWNTPGESLSMKEPKSESDADLASWQKDIDQSGYQRMGSYATLPLKRPPHQPAAPSLPPATSSQNIFSSNFNMYSTLPNMKPYKPFRSPELKTEVPSPFACQGSSISVTQPLWTNTDIANSQGQSSQDGDNHSSSSAMTSSDSHDTVVSRDTLREDNSVSKASSSGSKPIPIRVVHESGPPAPGVRQSRDGDAAAQPQPSPLSRSLSNSSDLFTSRTNGGLQSMKSPSSRPGVWTPGQQSMEERGLGLGEKEAPSSSSQDIVPVWTPGGSPLGSRKQFRPVTVKLGSPAAPKPAPQQQVVPKHARPEESYAWRGEDSRKNSLSDVPTYSLTYTPMEETTAPSGQTTASLQVNGQSNHSAQLMDSKDDVHLPPTQSPYITLLQRGRDGQLPKGANYLGKREPAGEIPDSTEAGKQGTQDGELKPVRYEGIGPVTEEGLPIAFRKNIDEKNQHAWYRQMYKNLHITDKKEGDNKYKPTYQFPDNISDTKSEDDLDLFKPMKGYPSRMKDDSGYRSEPEGKLRGTFSKYRSKSLSSEKQWTLPNARASHEVYRNQPRSIFEYEPGFSSIAFQENKASPLHNPPISKPGQFSRYAEGLRLQAVELGDGEEGDKQEREMYRQVQSGGEIPIRGLQKPVPEKPKSFRHPTSTEVKHSPEKHRRRREEEEAFRKKRLVQLQEEDRRKRQILEEADAEARRHSDLSPCPKSPISADRFEEGVAKGSALSVPIERRRGFQVQGKAKAVYSFTAQNPRELSFRKGDIIFLLRQVDKHWFEGELHGRVGILPMNYVEVLTSIEAAQMAAMTAEGHGKVLYSFTAQSPVELSLRKDDFVVLLRRVDKNWLEGRIGDRQGIFPASYVEVYREPSTPLVTPAPSVITTPMTGTPEMLSPLSFEAPTPPPQPSPYSSLQSLGMGPYGYVQPRSGLSPRGRDGPSSAGLLAPATTIPASADRGQRPSPVGRDSRIEPSAGLLATTLASPPPQGPELDGRLLESKMSVQLSHAPQKVGSPSRSFHSPGRSSFSPGRSSLSPNKSPLSPNKSPLSPNKSPLSPNKSPLSPNKLPVSPTVSTATTRLQGASTKQNGHSDAISGTIEDELIVTRYRAVYAYKPVNEDELELREGDEVYVMEKCDDGWYVGTSVRTGMFGTFPGNYVQPV